MAKKINNTDLYLSLGATLAIIMLMVLRDEDKWKIVKKDFSSISFIGFFLIILALTIIGLNSNNKKIKTSTRHALVAFLIAYLAHLDMVFGAFFLVGIFVYFTDDNLTY